MPSEPSGVGPDAPISVTELRDYHRINAEVANRLSQGAARVRLEGPDGHRLLLSGLAGPWEAVVEILGNAGPELAAGMDAPNITIVCHGRSADGAGSGLKSGAMLLLGATGTALAYEMAGGLVVAASATGPRAGLRMRGGDVVLLGPTGPRAAERQEGGLLLIADLTDSAHLGLRATGGERFQARPDRPESLPVSMRTALGKAQALRERNGRPARDGGGQ